MLLGNIDFSNLFVVLKQGTTPGPYASLTDAQTAGAVSINYGMFLNTIISFLIVAFAVFLVIRNVNKLKKTEVAPPAAPTTKECKYCFSAIPIKAVRCPSCTSNLT